MAAFHTDEYVQFLHKVTPETAEELTHNNQRCESPLYFRSQHTPLPLLSIRLWVLFLTISHFIGHVSLIRDVRGWNVGLVYHSPAVGR